jgi:hypothetical protein
MSVERGRVLSEEVAERLLQQAGAQVQFFHVFHFKRLFRYIIHVTVFVKKKKKMHYIISGSATEAEFVSKPNTIH